MSPTALGTGYTGLAYSDGSIYTPTTVYQPGTIVTYGSDRFLRVNSALTAPTLFTPSDWVPLNPLTLDNPGSWSTANASDQEFDASSSTPPSGWATFNGTGVTYTEGYGAGLISFAGVSTINLRGVVETMPAASAWEATMKLSMGALQTTSGNPRGVGLVLRENSTAKSVFLGTSDDFNLRLLPWTSDTANGADLVTGGSVRISTFPSYYRLRRNSSTSYDSEWSADGISWHQLDLARNLSTQFTTAPDRLGFAAYGATSTTRIQATCHWLRVR